MIGADPSIAPSKVYLHQASARLSTSDKQLFHPLGYLAQLYWWMHHNLLCHRERNPSLRRTCIPYRRSLGNSHVLPANGFHVAVRQLEPPRKGHQVATDGGLECVRHCHRHFPHDWRYVWLCRGDHGSLQGIWRVSGMVVRG